MHSVHHSGTGSRAALRPCIWVADCGAESTVVSNIRPRVPMARTVRSEISYAALINIVK